MRREKFGFALRNLTGKTWVAFEELASAFLAADFPGTFRTVASSSGDGGRDGELFQPDGEASVVFQFSVAEDWKTKIKQTARRVTEALPEARYLVYLTNQVIGAMGDELVQTLRRERRLIVEVRDQNWFLDRADFDDARRAAADRLVQQVAMPILEDDGLLEQKVGALSGIETRAAVVYLGLQWEDDTREKGLTRTAFEALVCAVLRRTDPDHRLSRDSVRGSIQALLPTHPAQDVDRFTDQALLRLAKRRVRRYVSIDEFCLTFEERSRLADRLAVKEVYETEFKAELLDSCRRRIECEVPEGGIQLDAVTASARRLLERFLLARGELFVAATRTGIYEQHGLGDLRDTALRELSERPLTARKGIDTCGLLVGIVTDIVVSPGAATQVFLRSLADSYTLFAFLRETPDVQAAVVKMFSYGELWFDTTVLLPLLAEELLEDAEGRRFASMVRAARDSGLSLRVSDSVLEEIERHINKSLTCSRFEGRWEGKIPFLFSAFILSGRPASQFGNWLELFRGQQTPRDDIAAYLEETFEIKLGSLADDARRAPAALRDAVSERWLAAQERRRTAVRDSELQIARRLAEHDTESFLGVIEKRRGETRSPLGYSAWWVTMDGTAFEIEREVARSFQHEGALVRPTMSPDFLLNYLTFGPVRNRVSRNTGRMLPITLGEDWGRALETPAEILDIAEKERERLKGQPERLIERQVRDCLLKAKQRLGKVARSGLSGAEASLREALDMRSGPPEAGRT